MRQTAIGMFNAEECFLKTASRVVVVYCRVAATLRPMPSQRIVANNVLPIMGAPLSERTASWPITSGQAVVILCIKAEQQPRR